MLGLRLHLLHEPRTLDGFREARIILDLGGDGELTAGLDARDHHRLQHRARGIDRRRGAGGAAAQNHNFGMDVGHGASVGKTGRAINRWPRASYR